jgi:hypothetical protein
MTSLIISHLITRSFDHLIISFRSGMSIGIRIRIRKRMMIDQYQYQDEAEAEE